jgi:16S rRNA (adenine1518-N6/adenine1519-N6)-dimethyltransferase
MLPPAEVLAPPVPRPPRARKRLGQHFLTDPRILARIVGALAPGPADTVIEIGPGRGALTEHLAAAGCRVIAIELDDVLAVRLQERFGDAPRVRILSADALDVAFSDVAGGDFLVAGNVPYYVTTPLLFHTLTSPRPARAVLLMQREVAERVVAAAGSRAYGALSVTVQSVAHAELVFRIAPGSFTPTPTVESALVRLTPLAPALVRDDEESRFRALVQGAFGFRRKQMRGVVRRLADCSVMDADAVLASAGVDPLSRPETVTPQQFVSLMRALERGASA